VGSSEQGRFRDAGHRTAVVRIGELRLAKHVLADPLDREALGLRGSTQPGRRLEKDLQRRIGETDAELVGAYDRRVHGREIAVGERPDARTVGALRTGSKFGGDAGVADREQPGTCGDAPPIQISPLAVADA